MPKFVISEIKEVVIEAEVTAKDAAEAITLYKRPNEVLKHSVTEDSHIVIEMKGVGE